MSTEIISPEAMQMFKPEESLEITKNSRGINWSYKLIGIVEEQLKRIDNIEGILKLKFGRKEEEEK